ncbi:MAG TPA: signal peptidase I [Candidatus Nanoarchaeia archaeon]|nr:signal peptidase I [Candidatus Nanoarchaeia archaeon]
MRWKTSAKKVYHFIFVEDSFLSWVVNFALAFLFVKFVLFPVLALALGTQLPLVAVISGSMEHEGMAFDQWWDTRGEWYLDKNISNQTFRSYSFFNGFDKGDVMVLINGENLVVGDVLVYSTSSYPYPIIHRVVAISEEGYEVKGDHNSDSDPVIVSRDKVVGKALYRIPKLGWVKIWAVAIWEQFKGGTNALLS